MVAWSVLLARLGAAPAGARSTGVTKPFSVLEAVGGAGRSGLRMPSGASTTGWPFQPTRRGGPDVSRLVSLARTVGSQRSMKDSLGKGPVGPGPRRIGYRQHEKKAATTTTGWGGGLAANPPLQ